MSVLEKPVYLSTKDFLVSGETFQLLYDEKTDMLVTSPQPKATELSKYYESDEYISHTDKKDGVMAFLYQSVKNYSLRKKISFINSKQKTKGSLLDVGAGTGDFLNKAKNIGWSVDGVEVHAAARELASQKGLKLFDTLHALPKKTYQVITLWHVLEHIPNLEETITILDSLLAPDGILIIAVPNYKSYDANYYKEFWAAYDVPRHLWHFSRKSLPKILQPFFKLESTRPMLFDSFYVSLLSERYKTGNNFSMKAFRIGLQSNIRAWRSKEYSSVLYCFKKA